MIHPDFQCEFYFIRHGESLSNTTNGYAAGVNFDAPMTPRGFEQARSLGRRLAREKVTFDRVYASTLCRAHTTAATMLEEMDNGHVEPVRVPDIMELQIPAWRGKKISEIPPEVMLRRAAGGKWFIPADGESERAVERRFSNWLEDNILYHPELGGQPGRQTIALVSHGHALRCLFHYIMGFEHSFIKRLQLDNCSISRFRFSADGWFPITINDASHTFQIGDVNRESAGAAATP